MILISTTQAADELNRAFNLTSITAEKVLALVGAGAFTDLGAGRSVRIDLSEIQAFASRVRVVTPAQWPAMWPIFRVSLLGLREDKIVDANGVVLRTHAGVAYSGGSSISSSMRELAWTGVWEVSAQNIQRAIQTGAVLFGTTKGYVDPNYVRQIVGARRTPSGSRIWWETVPAPAKVKQFVGAGLWMPVKPGRESDWA